MPTILPSQAFLRSLWDYNPNTGKLIWRIGRNRGKVAGVKKYRALDNKSARISVKLGLGDQTQVAAHRIIWKWMTGQEPPPIIDHKNNDPFDNSWSNLREANHRQNLANSSPKKRNLPKGVYISSSGRYYSKIYHNKQRTHLGVFDTPEEAHEAYALAAARIHKEFART